MFKFSLPLCASVDVNDCPTIAFAFKSASCIHSPFESECGRFTVDPKEAYGLTEEDIAEFEKLKTAINEATEDDVNVACLHMQKHLKIETGDVAGLYFSDESKYDNIKRDIIDYVVFEYHQEHGNK